MSSILLRDPTSGSTARIAPQMGLNCHEFRAVVGGETVDVIDAHREFPGGGQRPSGHGIPILFPFPNRIRGGRFRWQGRQYELPPELVGDDGAGNAIHGFCLDRPWRVVEQGESFVLGRFQLSVDAPERRRCWPADCLIEVRYTLRGPALRAEVRIANPDTVPLPFGFGTHPYFRLPLGAQGDPSECLIEVPAAERWELVDCLPTGRRIPVAGEDDLREGAYFGQLQLDDVYTGLISSGDAVECVIMDGAARGADSGLRPHSSVLSMHSDPLPGSTNKPPVAAGLQVSQRCDPIFREIVAFTPPGRNAVCLEPYTCLTDAVHLEDEGIDAGWRTLEPGGELTTWIEIRAGRILA